MPLARVPVIGGTNKYQIEIQIGDRRYKICKVVFHKGGIFLNFNNYFRIKRGYLAKVFKRKGQKGFELNNGKTVKHLVKYSHPSDGKAHFSQDSKILRSDIVQSINFAKSCGTFGLLFFRGINAFKSYKPRKGRMNPLFTIILNTLRNKDRGKLIYHFTDELHGHDEFFIQFEKYSYSELRTLSRYDHIAPDYDGSHSKFDAIHFMNNTINGEEYQYPESFIVNKDQDWVLVLSVYQKHTRIFSFSQQLIFYGGMPEEPIPEEYEFLYMSYPVDGFEGKEKVLGTLNYKKT